MKKLKKNKPHKLSMKDKPSWKIFMVKVRFSLLITEFRKWANYKLHCQQGYCNIRADSLKHTIQKPGKKSKVKVLIDTSWFKCLNCETKYFLTSEERKSYFDYNNKEKKRDALLFNMMLKQRGENGKERRWFGFER